jgi:hypothetical protein
MIQPCADEAKTTPFRSATFSQLDRSRPDTAPRLNPCPCRPAWRSSPASVRPYSRLRPRRSPPRRGGRRRRLTGVTQPGLGVAASACIAQARLSSSRRDARSGRRCDR